MAVARVRLAGVGIAICKRPNAGSCSMDVFDLRNRLVADYSQYTTSFIKIRDQRIKDFVHGSLDAGAFWPEPLLQLNPTFKPGGYVEELTAEGILHLECDRIFRNDKSDQKPLGEALRLHTHQVEAIRKAHDGKSYVLTSGTGSGKSLAYIVPIVDHVLKRGSGKGIQAIVVYPMNALANSQNEELRKYLLQGYGDNSPVRFARYTGQEKGEERNRLRDDPPDVLLTNYMMLELMLTRPDDRTIIRAAQGLRFLVFDELHTYRGRQGADVAMLIRRCRLAFGGHDFICVGTSATMASGGTVADQRVEVARVATTLFGTGFTSEQVIGETLERATPELDFSSPQVAKDLAAALGEGTKPPTGYNAFRNHPLSSWIESTFGVRSEPQSGTLVRQPPRRLRGEILEGRVSASTELAELTGLAADHCADVLRDFLIAGSNLRENASARFPLFAFRLHQFFTRGDTVWATLEEESTRYLEMSKKVSKPGEPDKPLYPLVFCRQCGAEYYRVRVRDGADGGCVAPREDHREKNDDGGQDGFVYVSREAPWPTDSGDDLLARLPAFMRETTNQGVERIKREEKKNVPEAVQIDPEGNFVTDGTGIAATVVRDNFLFCLNPECSIVYAKTQRSERAKLATLGVDNRSTATTILAIRALIELQHDHTLPEAARKLLSFTDNRQDASLQAGHFNDFAQVALLRSALYKAATVAGAAGVRHGELSRRVFEAMQLEFEEYANDDTLLGPAREATNDALRKVVEYFLYRDLQRGWRVAAPNLEECGLLRFEFEGLTGHDSISTNDAMWQAGLKTQHGHGGTRFVDVPAPLRLCDVEKRVEIVRTLLDVLRKNLAVKVDALNPAKQLDLILQTKPRLVEGSMWHLDDVRDLEKSQVAFPRTQAGNREYGVFVSSFGGYGRYLKRALIEAGCEATDLTRSEIDNCIKYLFLAMKCYGIIDQVRSNRDGEDPGYQINPAAMLWHAGDGLVRPLDRTRLLSAGEIPPEANSYFVECYRGFVDIKCVLEAREHTAQVAAQAREKREERFRSGSLPLLFCSPTMELGVDIAQLNLVNLRNVPPTPANYAQRSGRAGRGGQPALVFTYCAGRSPHDQYFFREPGQMVGGVVAPPRVDLRNRDLVRSHVQAVWLETAQTRLGMKLPDVLDLTPQGNELQLPINDQVRDDLRSLHYRGIAMIKAKALLDTLQDELAGASWYHSEWLSDVFGQLEKTFDSACHRWRGLYRSAIRQCDIQNTILKDHSRPEEDRKQARRLHSQAVAQLELLTSQAGIYEGDFYIYRYLAAEGFLPGYNFPRLPLSAFVPARSRRNAHNDFVSRPRFLAISEFGPGAVVYHEGARYRVDRVKLDHDSNAIEGTTELSTQVLKRCQRCGYAHPESDNSHHENCQRCGTAFEDIARIPDLVHLQNVDLKLAQRITCDEEERQRFGYKLVTAYRFSEVSGTLDRRDAEVVAGERVVMRLSYGDATDLFRINLGWSNMKADQAPGFTLDTENGRWVRNPADLERDDAAPTGPATRRVVPYVKDTKNALVMAFEPAPDVAQLAALQAAFREATQKVFQLESRELSCEPLPSPGERREILFYEASEGGAGVLRQLVEVPDVIPRLARAALEICHFDPDTLEDRALDRCGKACYECLLDYGNQTDHHHLDRYRIRDILAEVVRGTCRGSGGAGSRQDRLDALRRRCDSKLEQKWLDTLETLQLKLPSHAQFRTPEEYCQPDFYYSDSNTAIFVDGPPHDSASAIKDDEDKTRRLKEAGYIVIRFHHKDDWKAIFATHPDVFGVSPV